MYKFGWIMQLPSRFLGQRGIFLCDYKHQEFQFSPDGKLAKFGDPLFLILLINYFCSHLSTSSDPRSTIYDPTSISLDPTYQRFLTPHQLLLIPLINYFFEPTFQLFLIPLINYFWTHLSTIFDPIYQLVEIPPAGKGRLAAGPPWCELEVCPSRSGKDD